MAIRYSGEATIRLTWDETAQSVNGCGAWKCRISVRGKHVSTIYVGQSGPDTEISVDCPAAYDGAARSALAFADAELEEQGEHGSIPCAFDREGSDRHVGRTLATAWPA